MRRVYARAAVRSVRVTCPRRAAAAAAEAAACVSARNGERIVDRAQHEASYAHQLQQSLLQRLCCPERPLPWRCIYDEVTNASRRVSELHHGRQTRRLARQHAALRFLRRHNVLLHGLLFYAQPAHTWNCTSEFARLALYGEAVLRSEVQVRTVKLLPHLSSTMYTTLLSRMLCGSSYSRLFDALHLEQLVGARPPPSPRPRQRQQQQHDRYGGRAHATAMSTRRLSSVQKSNMLCAVLGEMHWFAARTRATERTHNNALFPPSDVLILHVLCMHLLECLPAELLLYELAPCVTAIRAAWLNERLSLPSQLHVRPRPLAGVLPHRTTTPPRRLDAQAVAAAADTTTHVACTLRPLSALPVVDAVRSTMRPRCVHRYLDAHHRCGHAVVPALQTTPQPPHADTASTLAWCDARRRALVRDAHATHFVKSYS